MVPSIKAWWKNPETQYPLGSLWLLLEPKEIGNITFVVTVCVEVNSELSQTLKMDTFAKTVKGFKLSRTQSWIFEWVFSKILTKVSWICFWRWQTRSSPSQMFFKTGVLKNFVIFTRKHPCWSLSFNMVAGLKSLLKGDFNTGVFLWILQNF